MDDERIEKLEARVAQLETILGEQGSAIMGLSTFLMVMFGQEQEVKEPEDAPAE